MPLSTVSTRMWSSTILTEIPSQLSVARTLVLQSTLENRGNYRVTEEYSMVSTANTGTDFLSDIKADIENDEKRDALKQITAMIGADQYVGDLINLDYAHADILVHDTHKNRTNGIPHGCLLIATRITPADLEHGNLPEDPSLLLIRVSESVKLNTDADLDKVRFEAVQRSNDTQYSYDESQQTDQFTLNMLRYAGIRCRILGTYRLYQAEPDAGWSIHFGSDIANFNAGQGMKIYKPSGTALTSIVNHRRDDDGTQSPVSQVGRLRYSSAIKENDTPDSAPIYIRAQDFVAQRAALFGMTRSGKSNTTKIIASEIFKLRSHAGGAKVGQLIFDPNGEYANDNPQDQGCIRNLQYIQPEYADQVHTYGSYKHPFDPDRHITKFNFFGYEEPSSPPNTRDDLDKRLHSLYQGKQIIDDALALEQGGYVQDFRNARVDDSAGAIGNSPQEWAEYTRFKRRLFIYRCILAEAGFEHPQSTPRTKGLFSKEIRDIMTNSPDVAQYADPLNQNSMTWDVAANFVKAFASWAKSDEFKAFNRNHAEGNDGRNWSDPHLEGLLRFYDNTRARSVTRNTIVWHSLDSADDYAEIIVQQVREGKLVIVDQLLGDPQQNRQAAERIVRRLLNAQQESFVTPSIDTTTGEIIKPPQVIVYAEEAHTLLPRPNEDDSDNIWAKIAKEGAKFNIGMVYSTQEPSAIESNILKNTENWFIAHLNNTDETNQIRKFNDFSDFTESIRNVSEAGLVKMRTKSSFYTIPVQIDEFKAPPAPVPAHSSNGTRSAQQPLLAP